jgi:hypothetical protein
MQPDFYQKKSAFSLSHTVVSTRNSRLTRGSGLRETGAGTQVIVAFSDMKEDLPPGLHRTLEESEFNDIRVVAANVKKLQRDNMDPAAYRERLDLWEKRVLECGALEWRVILDNAKLFEYLDDRV